MIANLPLWNDSAGAKLQKGSSMKRHMYLRAGFTAGALLFTSLLAVAQTIDGRSPKDRANPPAANSSPQQPAKPAEVKPNPQPDTQGSQPAPPATANDKPAAKPHQ
jgi:hypothetical protein